MFKNITYDIQKKHSQKGKQAKASKTKAKTKTKHTSKPFKHKQSKQPDQKIFFKLSLHYLTTLAVASKPNEQTCKHCGLFHNLAYKTHDLSKDITDFFCTDTSLVGNHSV